MERESGRLRLRGTWQTLSSERRGVAPAGSVAFSASGEPFMAWVEVHYDPLMRRYRSRVRAQRLVDRRWENLTSLASKRWLEHDGSLAPQHCVAVTDSIPCLALAYYSGTNWEVTVLQWDGHDWRLLGALGANGVSDNAGVSDYPCLIPDRNEGLVLAWSDGTSGNREIFVLVWDGRAWCELGFGSAHGGGISKSPGESASPSIALDNEGRPVVAWSDNSSGAFEIYARRWDGEEWQEIGPGSAHGSGISGADQWATNPVAAVDSEGRITLGWLQGRPGRFSVVLRRWDGREWRPMGDREDGRVLGSRVDGGAGRLALVLGQGEVPTIGWLDDEDEATNVCVLMWHVSRWAVLGDRAPIDGRLTNCTPSSSALMMGLGTDRLGHVRVLWASNDGSVTLRLWNASPESSTSEHVDDARP
jgi:hypothetical protein